MSKSENPMGPPQTPPDKTKLPVLMVWVLQVILAIAAFVLPLWFVHRRLVSEKRRRMAEINLRVESTSDRFHHALDKSEMVEAVQLNNVMNGLNIERNVVISLPTWPWRPGTLTGFLTAIVLPIILFIIQRIVVKWLGG
jgi:flagellar basal body-associated protein FliL